MNSTNDRSLRRCAVLFALVATLSLLGTSPVLAEDEPSDANASASGEAEAMPAPPPVKRPKFQDVRTEEDWSGVPHFADDDYLDVLKYIPFDDDGDFWLSIGGQLRVRGETWSNFAFGAPENNEATYVLGRLRLHTDWHLTRYFRVFVEGKSALLSERDLPGGKRPVDEDEVAIQQALIDINIPFGDASHTELVLRPGRQEIAFGKDRLVSPLDWVNTRRTWDGGRAIVRGDWGRVDAFYAHLVNVDATGLNTSSIYDDEVADVRLYGAYAALPVKSLSASADLYWLSTWRENATWGGVAGEEHRHTLGGAFRGKLTGTGFDYDVEIGGQFGDHAGRTISAGFASGTLGYTFPVATSPRVVFGLDYSSGDKDSTDDELGTFSQYYPLAHAYHGFIDITARQNLLAGLLSLSFKPFEGFLFRADGHVFTLSEGGDALYAPNGVAGRARGTNAGASNLVGYELDLLAKYALDRHAVFVLGYSRLFAGGFIEETGASDDIDFGYLMGLFTF